MELFQDLFERLGLFAILFIFLIRFKAFKRLLTGDASGHDKLVLSLLFGLAGVVATYSGFPFQGAIANLRGVAVALGGILGGPLVGLAAGLVAGSHRYLMDMNGLTSLSCGVATVFQGLLAALLYHRLRRRAFDVVAAFSVGAVNELIKMGFILLLARPFEAALNLVPKLAVPSLLVNGLGTAVFIHLISTVYREKELAKAEQAQKTLTIALQTLPVLRNGLTSEAARQTAGIVRNLAGLDAVLIADGRGLLAGETAHDAIVLEKIVTSVIVQQALATGTVMQAGSAGEVGCTIAECGLRSAVVVPLKKQEQTIGVLGLFRTEGLGIGLLDLELATGLSQLFSNQLELGEIENHRRLAAAAEIKALQAQINPHFLFNAISTIKSYIRTDPGVASQLLVHLAEFFRKTTSTAVREVPLAVELEHCEAYLAIEKARFEERIRMRYSIDEAALSCPVPPLILQPLVENGIRHGILPKETGGEITISATMGSHDLHIRVADNGVGMSQEKVAGLLSEQSTSSREGLGIALKNVNSRLIALYGTERALSIESEPGIGTTISFSIPVTV